MSGGTATGMQLRRLGDSTLEVSVVGVGCNNFGRRIDAAQTERVVHAALDAGITLFDTADLYGDGLSEEYLGRALKGRRDGAVVATKFGFHGHSDPSLRGGSPELVERAVEASLRRLGVNVIDLYQLHSPDPETPVENTLEAMHRLVESGKVRFIGCSNFAGWQIADADWIARTRGLTRFVSAQNEYSLLDRGAEREVIPACERFGLGMLPFFPLANGLLTGKYRRGEPAPEGTRLAGPRGPEVLTDTNFDVVERLEAYARERGIDLLTVAISGLAAQPAVASVIAGATKPEQVERNAAAGRRRLSAEDLAELDRIVPSPRPER